MKTDEEIIEDNDGFLEKEIEERTKMYERRKGTLDEEVHKQVLELLVCIKLEHIRLLKKAISLTRAEVSGEYEKYLEDYKKEAREECLEKIREEIEKIVYNYPVEFILESETEANAKDLLNDLVQKILSKIVGMAGCGKLASPKPDFKGCGTELEIDHYFGIEGNTKIVHCGDEDYLCEECKKKKDGSVDTQGESVEEFQRGNNISQKSTDLPEI